jgi:hypothetical protein
MNETKKAQANFVQLYSSIMNEAAADISDMNNAFSVGLPPVEEPPFQ